LQSVAGKPDRLAQLQALGCPAQFLSRLHDLRMQPSRSHFYIWQQPAEFIRFSCTPKLARNLYVALRLAATDAVSRKSPMDFRSNEAGRTAVWEANGATPVGSSSVGSQHAR
jgi:hypothetical protein